MSVAESISAWREFYAAVASVTAALLGLVYVGMSLHLSLRQDGVPVRPLAMSSAIVFIQPLLVSLLMLIPIGAPTVHGMGALVLAAVLAAELVLVLRMPASRDEAAVWLVYRYGVPFVATALLAAGGIGMLAGWSPAVWAPALFVFATVVVGVQDAWDLLVGLRRRESTPPHAADKG